MLFNKYETYGTTYKNIHTDTACVQHVNVGLAQARPNENCTVQLASVGLAPPK